MSDLNNPAADMAALHQKKQETMLALLKDVEPEIGIVFEMLARRIAEWNRHQGFWFPSNDQGNTGEKLMLMVSELGEALEADRKNLKDQHLPQFDGLTVELADTIIRILDFAGQRKLPLAAAFIAKLQYNLGREYRHGKKY